MAEQIIAQATPVSAAPSVPTGTNADFQGEPNGLPPALPGVQHEPAPEVVALEQWWHAHIPNSVHSRDTEHHNRLLHAKEALRLMLQSKHPVEA